jgi:subtilisin family serine protease
MRSALAPTVVLLTFFTCASGPASVMGDSSGPGGQISSSVYKGDMTGTAADRPRPETALVPGAGAVGSASEGSGMEAEGMAKAQERWWVFFKDKDLGNTLGRHEALKRAERSLSSQARERRLQVLGSLAMDENDIPVSKRYIQALKDAGLRIWGRSRWLNAVSVYAADSQLESVSRLPFVKRVAPVATYRRKESERTFPADGTTPKGLQESPAVDPSYYNRTYNQLQQINVPAVHDLGYTGSGVIICMLDTGYNRRHEALTDVDVIAEWDFVQNDSVTSNQAGDDPNQHNHGTYTLSAIAGFKPGAYVGGAYNAQFMLGKTEIYDQEIQIEEDNYVMGLEWADSGGARIVSSSLGYLDWYTYDDMDGDTAVTTIGVDIAASKGITVVTAMGNEASSPWHYLIAPADADTVISVGAVYSNGTYASFSSVGPTADGRIKPDVVALGVNAYAASPFDSTGYVMVSGTSLSTPLVASVAALLAQAHPTWGPTMISYALRSTADQAFAPDNLRGWGLVDALAALQLDITAAPAPRPRPVSYCRPNPFSSRTTLYFDVAPGSTDGGGAEVPVEVMIYDVEGRLIRTLFRGPMPLGPHTVQWDGADSSGHPAPSGLYALRVSYPGGGEGSKVLLIR